MGRVDDVLIDLVGNHIGIIFPGKRRDNFQLLPGKDLAAGVGGVAQYQRLGLLAEGILQHRRVKMEIRRYKRYINRLRPGENGVRAVVFIEGGKDNHLVSRIGDGHHCRHHGLGAAAGDNNLAVGIDGPAHIAGLLGSQRLPEVLGTPGNGILVEVLVGHLRQPVCDGLRRVKVREALREVHGAVLHGHPGHAADHRIGEARGAFR